MSFNAKQLRHEIHMDVVHRINVRNSMMQFEETVLNAITYNIIREQLCDKCSMYNINPMQLKVREYVF